MKKWNLGKKQLLGFGKKQLLGFMTAGAIVVTMAGSYAAWDELSNTTNATMTWGTPVKTTTTATTFNETRTLGEVPSYTSDVGFKVENLPNGVTANDLKATYTAVVKDGQTEVNSSNYTIEIAKGATTLTNGVDESISTGAENKYSVTIIPNDDDAAKAVAGKELTVEVTGTLSKKAL